MHKTEKAISLFKYIKELYAQRIQVIADVRKQNWCKFIYELPSDKENIILNYFDRTDEVIDDGTDPEIILQIRKPEFEKCPALPSMLNRWIEGDWNDFMHTVTPKKIL